MFFSKLCLLLLAVLPVSAQEQAPDRPLPELKSFLQAFRKTLHDDNTLLSQYTYTQKETHLSLDGKGKTKKEETGVYQIFHGDEDYKTYHRQLIKNGIPLTEKELEKQDREEKERVAKETKKRDNKPESRRLEEKAKADREEQEVLDDVFDMYDVQMIRREMIGGTSTILLTFKPKPNYKTKTGDAKNAQHLAGRAWVAEEDHELARLEAEVIDPISIGAGFLAKLQRGSTLAFERHKVNNEIWLPVKAEVLVNARLLLLKGFNVREVVEYSEHKKYSVDTILTFGDAPVKTKP